MDINTDIAILGAGLSGLAAAEVKKFSERYGVDYLVLEKEYYDESFLKRAKTSSLPNYRRLTKVLNETTENPEDIYRKAEKTADFFWTAGGKEGLVSRYEPYF